jgi:uncharacterized protein YjiK
MPYRRFIFIVFALMIVVFSEGCISDKYEIQLNAKNYDLNHPRILRLNDALLEISGISFYPKDSSVFAISDESGNLYKIHLTKNFVTEKWKFDKTRDFEDIVFYDNTFYILESNGNIYSLNFSPHGDTVYSRKNIFPSEKKEKNDFESLFYDAQKKTFTLICKNCEADKKNAVSAWEFNPANGAYELSTFTIHTEPIAKKLKDKNFRFRPSAAAINPTTGDVWILSAVNEVIVVTDRNGIAKEVFTINPVIFTQPEGIAFTPWGDLIISNEAGDKYSSATLFFFKQKKA